MKTKTHEIKVIELKNANNLSNAKSFNLTPNPRCEPSQFKSIAQLKFQIFNFNEL